MTKNPFVNALAAALYIIVVASIMFYGPHMMPREAFAILIPIAMISLFTLSAAVMGYLFLSEPLQLYLDGKKKEAIQLFLKTIFIFAGITAIFLLILLLSSFL